MSEICRNCWKERFGDYKLLPNEDDFSTYASTRRGYCDKCGHWKDRLYEIKDAPEKT